jgi:hypothetical protein
VVDVELEALRTSTTWVQDMVLDGADESSSLAASLSTAAELLECCASATTANGVHWGTQSMLVVALSHSPELETKLELLRSGWNTDLMENQVDAL